MDCLRNLTKEKQRWWWIMVLFTSGQTWNHKLSSWYCPLFMSNIQFSKTEVKPTRRIASAQIQVERKIEQIEEHLNSAKCQLCNYDKFVTSTCFSIRVNTNLVNTTVQPKGNMPDHLYHGNMKCVCRSNILCLTFIFLQTHVYMFLCLTICLFTIWSAVIIY